MEKGFDFSAILRDHGKQHKYKPDQFKNVASGVKKRLETTLKQRRNSRLSIFDRIRKLPQHSPVLKPINQLENNEKLRKMQLLKWKEEKEKKKKEIAAQKKKPFIVGKARTPPKLGPPSKVMPSTSGRVTRSQTSKNKPIVSKTTSSPTKAEKSFAPDNRLFRPPAIKGIEELPILILPTSKKTRVTMVQFNPVITDLCALDNNKPSEKLNNVKHNKSKNMTHKKAPSKSDSSELNSNKSPRTKNKINGKNKVLSQTHTFSVESSHSDTSLESPVDITKSQAGKSKNKVQGKTSRLIKKQSQTRAFTIEHSQSESSADSPIKIKNKKQDKSVKIINKQTTMKNLLSDSSFEYSGPTIPLSRNLKSKQDKRTQLNKDPSSSDSCVISPVATRTRKTSNFIKRSSIKENKIFTNDTKEKPKQISINNSLKTKDPSIKGDLSSPDIETNSVSIKKASRKSLGTPKSKKNQNSTKFTPLKPIPNCESSSEERLRSPKDALTPEQISELSHQISPCITISRGKGNARKEMQNKLKEGLLDEHLQTLDTVDHFHRLLNQETNRLTEMADHWERMLEQNSLPEGVQEAILAAVGQARLLMSQKFQQFAGLVDRCEALDPTQPLVTPGDLQGFWDMVYMQVENLDIRFKKLEEIQGRGWTVEEQHVEKRRKVVSKPKNTKPAPASRIKDMIAAARKAKKEQQANALDDDSKKTFEAGFFYVKSPVRSPVLATPSKPPTLLKAVLSSEAKKASASKSAASYAMLRASMIGKNVEQDYNTSVNLIEFTPVNLNATPGRSILKSSIAKSSRKSIKMVLFDSSDVNVLDSSLDKEISGIHKLNSGDSPDSDKDSCQEETIQCSTDEYSRQNLLELSTDEGSNQGEKTKNSVDTKINQGIVAELIMDKENCQDKDSDLSKERNSIKKGHAKSSKLTLKRQDAVDSSPIRTRSSRKSNISNKEVLQECNINMTTPRRSLRRKTIAGAEV